MGSGLMLPLFDPPLFKDSGYLYVVPVIVDERGNKRPPKSIPSGYTVRYGVVGGTEYAVIRRPDPVVIEQEAVPVAAVLSDAQAKGFDVSVLGRIRGR